jgi:NhaA family Na+:H+ antiporter
MKQLVGDFKACCPPTTNALKNMEQHSLLLLMMEEVRLTETPLQRVQNALHIPTSLIVIPLFAFANAGIAVSLDELVQVLSNNITIGIMLGLILGKFLGITGFSWIVLKTGFAKLPEGMKMIHLAGGALLAGIGFTMSIFIAELSFSDNDVYLNTAKAAIILSSLLAGIVGVIWLGLCNKFLNKRSATP